MARNCFETPFNKRKLYGETYRQELNNLNKIKLLPYYKDREPNYQIFPIHVQDRERFANYMWNNDIQIVVNNRRHDKYSLFGKYDHGKKIPFLRDLPNLKKADEDTILLPIHYDLTESQISHIIELIRNYDKS